jgi:ATP-binding cassette, subfamily B, heavy metal transporter
MKKNISYAPIKTGKEVELVDLSSAEEGKALVAAKAIEPKKTTLTFFELLQVLLPYFWPEAGMDGALVNRIRSTSTWMMVILSKGCNLYAPFFIASAANDLLAGKLATASKAMAIYCLLRLLASFFREMQSILYIKVKQQASIQLQELTFRHLHSLSLTWHLSKKTGSVMKSMDRGVDAANSLVTYMFLFLIPAMGECLAVAVLFFVKYSQWQLGVLIVIGVALYTAVTITITEWRKKFREATNKHDNDYHDKATDSIINYETVKYFTGEEFEIQRFTKSVIQFQKFSSNTQFSLNVLNVSQQVILMSTMLGTMLVAGRAVVNGHMTVGGWVAVQSWVVSLFAPLNFLGR